MLRSLLGSPYCGKLPLRDIWGFYRDKGFMGTKMETTVLFGVYRLYGGSARGIYIYIYVSI